MNKKRMVIIFMLGLIVGLLPLLAGEIHDAAKEGNLERIKALVKNDPGCVNKKTDSGLTPLHYAAYRNRSEAIKLLLGYGVELEAKTLEGETPLHMTSYSGALEAAKILIEKGAKLEARNVYGRTPFIMAARESGDVELAKLLLDKGVDFNAKDKYDDSALMLAAWRGYGDFVDLLLDKGAKIPDNTKARLILLNQSVKRRLERLMQALINAGLNLVEVSKSHPQLILAAAAGGSTRILQQLVKQGFDPNYTDTHGWTPLHNAAEYGRSEAVKYLLSLGARINARTKMGETAFNIAQSVKKNETAQILKKNGAQTSPPRFPVLKGEYLGQKKPGKTPIPFAPGIVTAHYKLHSSITFSTDGQAAFWSFMPPRESGYESNRMLYTTVKNGKWTYPAPPGFIDGDVPFFSPDGKRLYFISKNPVEKGTPGKKNIWFVEKTKTGWSEPTPVDPVVNSTVMQWQFSLDKKSTFYIGSGDGRILVSQKIKGKYQTPTDFRKLYKNDSVKGESPFISPDGDYLIFSKNGDLYITFRKPGGSWTLAQNLGENINTSSYELCPIVSPDGEYLFFLSTGEGAWRPLWAAIKDTLNNLRKKVLNPAMK